MAAMETVTKKYRREEENEIRAHDDDETEDCWTLTALKLPEEILKHLPTPDLLTCSLVCKTWNYESRFLLRDSGTLVANIKGPDPCVKLKEFDTLLSSMTVTPYSGLRINVTEDTKSIYCIRPVDLDELYPSILKRNLKYLQIKWTDWKRNHDAERDCAAILLLRKCFRLGQHLEQIDIVKLPERIDLYSAEVIDELELPKLQVLTMPDDQSVPSTSAAFRLVKAAPKLEQIFGKVFSDDNRHGLPADKLKCVTNLDFNPETVSEFDFVERVALCGAKLQKLNVSTGTDLNQLWRVLRVVLEQRCCKDSLTSLSVDFLAAFKLRNFEGSLGRLEKLEIGSLHRDFDDLSLVPLLGNIDFTALFPALKSLTLNLAGSFYEEEELEWYFTAEVLAQRELLSHIYEGELKFSLSRENEEPTLRIIAATFPNIRSLDVRDIKTGSVYTLLWELWSRLQRLTMEPGTYYAGDASEYVLPFFNLDAEFCGISMEEAAELQRQGEDYLEKVQIVPTKPGITTLKDLKALSLRITASGPKNLTLDASNLFVLSKVTGYLAFRRMTGVDIRLEVFHDDITEFRHLAPYVSVVECED